nr:rhomboid family intramembrane serine protease [Homoserinibacter gongjuensis]
MQCPECVREAGGSVQWTPTNTKPVKKRTAARRAPVASGAREGFSGWITGLLRPGGESPPLSWIFAGALVVLWILGLFTSNLPFLLLAADPAVAWQLWRYVTAPFATPAQFSIFSVLGIAISLFFWLLIAPTAERTLGRARFLLVFTTAAAVGSAAMVIAGAYGFGFSAALFGVFGAYAVLVWSYPPARMQIIGVLVINLIINIYVGAGTRCPTSWVARSRARARPTCCVSTRNGRARRRRPRTSSSEALRWPSSRSRSSSTSPDSPDCPQVRPQCGQNHRGVIPVSATGSS